ncbi:MAG TPA: class IV adenylate cyclase [Candidatus Moranbacteria bacterium]|nr:class IV adenylate cyclase [Candidatus Moranbacteria bacterium]
MKNIEVKVCINSFNDVIHRLEKIGAKYKGELHQVDRYYNCRTGRLKLREIDKKNLELIFYSRPDKKSAKVSDYEILEVPENLKQKTEKTFKKAFGEKVIVKKDRKLWMYKNTRIHLDKVAKLGYFLELETLVKKNMKKSKEEYKEIFSFLDLDKYKKYKKSYSDMLLAKI